MSEIERKFQMRFVPGEVQALPPKLIEQGYLFHFDAELRLRRMHDGPNSKFFLTVKDNQYLEREEWEQETPRWVFESLWGYVKHSLRKIRVNPPSNTPGVQYEVDTYLDGLDGLLILECVFDTLNLAENFSIRSLPSWAATAREVTGDYRYKNKHLAQATPEDIAWLLKW